MPAGKGSLYHQTGALAGPAEDFSILKKEIKSCHCVTAIVNDRIRLSQLAAVVTKRHSLLLSSSDVADFIAVNSFCVIFGCNGAGGGGGGGGGSSSIFPTHVTCFNPVTSHLLISLNESVEFVKANPSAVDCPTALKLIRTN